MRLAMTTVTIAVPIVIVATSHSVTGVRCGVPARVHSVRTMRSHASPTQDPAPAGTRPAIPTEPAVPEPRLPVWARVLLPTVLFLPLAMAGAVLLVIPGFADLLNRPDTAAVWAYVPVATTVLAAYLAASWALVRWVDRRPISALGLRFGRRAGLALLCGYAIAQIIALVAGWATQALGLARTADLSAAAQPETVPVAAMLLLVFLRAFVLQGIGEEVLFRGYLLQSLRRRPIQGVVIAAAAFTLPHLASSGGQQSLIEHLLYLVLPFGFAISAGFLAIATRSVWAAVGIHGGFHLALFVATAVGVTAQGPAVWLATGLLHLLAGVVIAALIPRERWAEVRDVGPYGQRPA